MTDDEKTPIINYDNILMYIGQIGKWQWINFFLLCLTSAAAGLGVVVFAFTGLTPAYRCAIPYCPEDSFDNPLINSSLVIPQFALNINSNCSYYTPKGKGIATSVPTVTGPRSCNNYLEALRTRQESNFEIATCRSDQVVADKSLVRSSLVIDYNLTCERSGRRAFLAASYMLGMLVGSFVIGLISDHYGRLKALVLSVIIMAVAGFLGAFVPDAVSFGILRFITGIGGIGCFMVSFVLAVEYVGYKFTMLIGIAIEIPFAIGEFILGLEAYFIRNWVSLQLVAYTPLIVLVLLWFIVDESPRWLIAKRKFGQAKKIVEKAAKINGKTNVNVETLFKGDIEEGERKENVLDLFRPPTIMLRSFNMFYQWFSVTMCYYGLSFASTSLSGDAYTNFCLSVFIEIPAYLFCLFVMDCWGRRPILSFCQIVSGISCIFAGLLLGNKHLAPLQIVLSLFGKFGASACFAIVYVYTAELFPTIIRNTAIGSCSTVARVGGICALLLNLLSDTWEAAPMIIMGCVAFVAGILALFFPETLGERLPDTTEEALNVGKSSKKGICQCKCPNDITKMFVDDSEPPPV